jgi:hypothetical protein
MGLRGILNRLNPDDIDAHKESLKNIIVQAAVAVEAMEDNSYQYENALPFLVNAYTSLDEDEDEEEAPGHITGNEAYKVYVETYGKVYMGKSYDKDYAYENFFPSFDWNQVAHVPRSIIVEIAETVAEGDKASRNAMRKLAENQVQA